MRKARKAEITAFKSNRAAWAAQSLDTAIVLTRCDPGEDAVTDLITNLSHYADRHRLDFPVLLKRAIGHWLTEQTDPESITPPDVAIYAVGVEITSSW